MARRRGRRAEEIDALRGRAGNVMAGSPFLMREPLSAIMAVPSGFGGRRACAGISPE
jgi:hypothetical protein